MWILHMNVLRVNVAQYMMTESVYDVKHNRLTLLIKALMN